MIVVAVTLAVAGLILGAIKHCRVLDDPPDDRPWWRRPPS